MGVAKSRSCTLMLLWSVINVCLLLYIVFAWLAASGNSGETCHESGSSEEYKKSSTGFVLIWQIILAVVISIKGTHVLRVERTEFSLGLFVGMTLILGNWMFTVAISSGARVIEKRNIKASTNTSTDVYLQMEAATAVLLFLLYMILCALLVKWKPDLIGEKLDTDPDAEDDDICTDIPQAHRQIQLT